MSMLDALLDELDDAQLDKLAAKLAPKLAERLAAAQPADRWLRGAGAIADYLGCPVSRIYALSSAGRIPIQKDGSATIARTSDLDAWVRAGGGKRP